MSAFDTSKFAVKGYRNLDHTSASIEEIVDLLQHFTNHFQEHLANEAIPTKLANLEGKAYMYYWSEYVKLPSARAIPSVPDVSHSVVLGEVIDSCLLSLQTMAFVNVDMSSTSNDSPIVLDNDHSATSKTHSAEPRITPPALSRLSSKITNSHVATSSRLNDDSSTRRNASLTNSRRGSPTLKRMSSSISSTSEEPRRRRLRASTTRQRNFVTPLAEIPDSDSSGDEFIDRASDLESVSDNDVDSIKDLVDLPFETFSNEDGDSDDGSDTSEQQLNEPTEMKSIAPRPPKQLRRLNEGIQMPSEEIMDETLARWCELKASTPAIQHGGVPYMAGHQQATDPKLCLSWFKPGPSVKLDWPSHTTSLRYDIATGYFKSSDLIAVCKAMGLENVHCQRIKRYLIIKEDPDSRAQWRLPRPEAVAFAKKFDLMWILQPLLDHIENDDPAKTSIYCLACNQTLTITRPVDVKRHLAVDANKIIGIGGNRDAVEVLRCPHAGCNAVTDGRFRGACSMKSHKKGCAYRNKDTN